MFKFLPRKRGIPGLTLNIHGYEENEHVQLILSFNPLERCRSINTICETSGKTKGHVIEETVAMPDYDVGIHVHVA